MTADENSVCQAACPPDVIVSGATLAEGSVTNYAAGLYTSGDPCPETFIIRFTEFSSLPTTEATVLTVSPAQEDEVTCSTSHTIQRLVTQADGTVLESIVTGQGRYQSCAPDDEVCVAGCIDMPMMSTYPSDGDVVEFRTAAFPGMLPFTVTETIQ
jgi:hypothetical protein